jgi:RNA polymerase subunit RPABC4/transcription elongation factor Spt4
VELSNDDGGNWTEATPDTDMEFTTVGSNLRYRVNFSSASVLEDIRINITLETLYPSDLTLDVGLDSHMEWTWPGQLTGSEALPDLSASMTAYVAAHASEVDPEGNVSVPMRFTSATAGWLYLSGLSVTYNMPPTIKDFTPKGLPINMNEGQSMTFTVNASDFEAQPLVYGWMLDGTDLGFNTSSYTYTPDFNSSGGHNLTVTVSDGFSNCSNNWEIRVKNVNRPPVLADISPNASASVSEGQSLLFHALASDPDSDNLTVDWYLDLAKIKTEREGDATFGYHPGFGDGGEHNITVMAYDGAIRTIYSWAVSVMAVNPLTDMGTSFPVQGNLSVDENSSQNFSVDLAPLKALLGNSTTVKWSLDGNLTVTGADYVYTTDFLSSGIHIVRASAFAGRLTYTRSWNVNVIEKDNPPSLTSSAPGYNPNIKEGTKQLFSVVVSDPDNDTLSYKWYLNGTEVSEASAYTYEAGWKSEGRYSVMVVVSDGRISVNHSWQLTVLDASRPVSTGGISSGVIIGIIAAIVVMMVLGGVMFYAYRKRERFSDALDHFGAGAPPAPGAVQAASVAPPPPPDVTPKPKQKATYPCPNCGGTVEEDWFLCHHCDAPLQVVALVTERAMSARETMAGDEALQKALVRVEASECPRCGKMLDTAAENCPTCGEYIRRPVGAAVMPASMATCPSCKSPVEEGWLKCPECGAELQAP